MKKGSTLFLKGVLCIMTIILITLCVFAFPAMSRGMVVEFPVLTSLRYPILFGLYAAAIPFFVAIYQAFRLLNHIDKNIAFSSFSVQALRRIKYCGVIMTVILMLFMPVAFMVAESDDAPGAVVIAFLLACLPIVVSVFAAVLQKLLENAIELKSENDLTV